MNELQLALKKIENGFQVLKSKLDEKGIQEVLLVELATVLALHDILICALKRDADKTSANNLKGNQ